MLKQQVQTENKGSPKDPKKKFLILAMIILFIVLIIVVALVFQRSLLSSSTIRINSSSPSANLNLNPNPTPFPFEELTIPFLRAKDYQSNLGPLTQIATNPSYTSYLTNYTSDGLKINGLLTIPKGEKPSNGWPAIIFIHGYIPPSQYQTLSRYQDYVDYLANSGFVVFKIDLRGHGTSEGEASGAYYSSDYIIDALNAYASLQNTDFVNPKSIGMWGHSMAGNIVLRALATKSDIPAAVIWAGAGYTYIDLTEYGIDDNSYQPPSNNQERQRKRQQLRQLYGDPNQGNPFWAKVIPTNFLSDFKGAIQLNHAVDDDVVNIAYSRNLDTLLTTTSIPHQLFEYPSGGHNISGPSFNQAMKNTVDFFKKYLPSN